MLGIGLWLACLWLSVPVDVPDSYLLRVTATGYCPCVRCTDGDGLTATGRGAWRAGVAVDPDVIPLGSHVDVPGVSVGPNGNGSWLLADDTGRLVRGAAVDVRFVSHREAREFGRRMVVVRVWRKP